MKQDQMLLKKNDNM